MPLLSKILLCFCLCALLGSPLSASAKSYNVDITCNQLSDIPESASGTIFYWLPGWWGGLKNDPHVNEVRVHLLVDKVVSMCWKDQNTRILTAARTVNSLPPVPDNALQYKCKDFLDSDPKWQFILVYWLQGYAAYKSGTTLLDDNYKQINSRYTEACLKNENLRMGDLLHLSGSPQRSKTGKAGR